MVADFIADGVLPADGLPFVKAGDLETIATQMDFLGLNYYFRSLSRSAAIPEAQNLPPNIFQAPKDDVHWTEMGWEIYPQGLFEVLSWLYYEYKVNHLYVTENGCSFSDGPDQSGQINDQRRINYLHDHLVAAKKAIDCGIPLAGYFVWSLMDNFEWAHGFSQRFGLVWIDYETGQRIPKASAKWYANVIHENAVD
jgi:beta-glucosidase